MFSTRAEQIAAHLVSHATGAIVDPHDIDGRQGVVDFLLRWPNGATGALEVTLIVEHASIEWQALAASDGWRWPAASSWDFRASEISFRYKSTRQLVLRAVDLCDHWAVDDPKDLPHDVHDSEPGLRRLVRGELGSLTRNPLSPGITVYAHTRAEFVEAAPSDFSNVIESWHAQPHMASHVEKLTKSPEVSKRHLFLVAMDDVLPAKFFTDDFEPPATSPAGFESVDTLWVWSNYWYRFLRHQDRQWTWVDFPPASDA